MLDSVNFKRVVVQFMINYSKVDINKERDYMEPGAMLHILCYIIPIPKDHPFLKKHYRFSY